MCLVASSFFVSSISGIDEARGFTNLTVHFKANGLLEVILLTCTC